ncbi:MAG: PqqD family protein [Lachnospiraceae bacterium]|nr:PqqD family protein [Lachnospiraceae bacterium]
MKLKSNFVLTELVGEYVAVSMDPSTDFHGVVKLNKSGAEVFRALNEGLDEEQCIARLMEKFSGLDRETAGTAVELVVKELRDNGLLEE